ncbi:amidohydrolase family protein [Gluconacetobacter aggeris]|uniref:Amidohydrolase family protein n=1 Tax=Gluconacetobacter aggeris TaxID=1286186 RepID=A0A7W4IUK8_9PROT|nr:amidohydrolase family protein [Gluconacetobacter aggeris]MBB2169193.1 amidohydrolase family protein [Gluconacetobacter aggeris]
MRLLIRARNRQIAVDAGKISDVRGDFDLVLNFPDAEIHPGLINAHDHLHRNHYGRLGHPPYRNAYEWAVDIQAREADRIALGRARPRREALLEGAWKNLFSGVTTAVHHDPWEADFDAGFPLKLVRLRNADSLGMTPELAGTVGEGPFCLHVAEGVDFRAAAEIDALAERGVLGPELLAVHGVGMDAASRRRFRASGAALVWCPSSNLFLFGRTASAALLAEGVDVLLGSDSRLTGCGDLLDELACARRLGMLGDGRLLAAVGATAAYRLGLPVPSLETGSMADLVILRRPILEACAEDVLLVLVDGVPRIAHPSLGASLAPFFQHAEERTAGGVVRWTALPAAAWTPLQ